YLLATTFLYFKRCSTLKTMVFNQQNFFVALYIANEMEEDEDDYKYEIFPWALGENWSEEFAVFFQWRDSMLIDLDFNVIAEKSKCDEVFYMYFM
ncbi:hypothetical protein HELRODRAFT_68524, partial [Helobdella robusta]|uniref:Uncharacterized protein n=1 Tax=Helobdella robusta TaxID=6412 RepID=T1FZG3_HELRO